MTNKGKVVTLIEWTHFGLKIYGKNGERKDPWYNIFSPACRWVGFCN